MHACLTTTCERDNGCKQQEYSKNTQMWTGNQSCGDDRGQCSYVGN